MPEPSARPPGFVYFVQGGGLVKVGWTGGPPLRRFEGLRHASPTPLRLLGCLPAYRRLESSLHDRMAPWRQHGEWFAPNPVLQAALDVVAWIGYSSDLHDLDPRDESQRYSSADEILRFADDLVSAFSRHPQAPERILVA